MEGLSVFVRKRYEVVRYVLVNGVTTALYIFLYYFFNEYGQMDYRCSNFLSYFIAVLAAYFLTAVYVFGKRDGLAKSFWGFMAQRVLFILINSILMWSLVGGAGLDKYFSQIAVTGVCFFGSYFLNRKLFKR